MGNLDGGPARDRIAVGEQQSIAHECLEHQLHFVTIEAERIQLRPSNPSSRLAHTVLVDGDEAQHDRSSDLASGHAQILVRRLGAPAHGVGDAADDFIVRLRQQVAVPTLHELGERELEQWQCTRCRLDVTSDTAHQPGFPPEPHGVRRDGNHRSILFGIGW